jgi:predicted RNA-binding Zn ribbon-like protein
VTNQVDFGHYSDDSVRLAVALVNTHEPTSDDTGEDLATAADLGRFLARHGLGSGMEPTEADLAAVHELRAKLRAVFAAPDETTAATTLNELLAGSEPVPRLSDHAGHWHLHVGSRAAGPAAQLRAITSLGLALVLAQEGKERLGLCADQDCVSVFVDSSKNLSRRYCSEGCANRANVRAYRARHRAPEARGPASVGPPRRIPPNPV